MNFDDYIQQLLGNTNPQGNMFTGLSSMPPSNNTLQANTGNPFNIQNAIDARNASNVVPAPPVAAAVAPQVSTPATTGMLGGGADGGYDNTGTTPTDPNGYFDIDQFNNFLSVVDTFTNAVPTPLSLALSAYAAYQDPNSVINNPHTLFEQFTNPALNAREDDSPVPQYGQIPSMQAAVNAQANAMPVDPGVQAAVNANQAVTTPVDMGLPPTTPLGMLSAPPMAVDPSIQAAVDAQAAAESQAAVNAQANAMAVDPGVQAAVNAQAQGMFGGGGGYGGGGSGGSNADGNSGGGGGSSGGQGAGTAAGDAAGNSEGSGGPADGSGSAGGGGEAASGASIGAAPGAGIGMGVDGGLGGPSSGGDKIICTAMNSAYGFGSFRNAIWIKYADKHLTKAHEVGYHTLFLPLVDFGFKRGDGKLNLAVRKVLEWGTRHRSTDLRAELRNKKRDTTGRIIRSIFEPLCFIVGKLKGY